MARYDNILETIGNTPLVRLNRLAPAGVNLYVKLESFNPLGSVKDRLALAVIEDAERSGALKPGQTVIEATSGNTGIGLAMVCAQKGYPLVVTMAENFSVERRKLLRFLGARVVLTPAAEKGTGMLQKAVELAETHGWFLCRQFENEANAEVHSRTTAREILADFDGERLDYFVTGLRHRRHAARASRAALKAVEPGIARSSRPSPTTRRCSAAASRSRATRDGRRRRAIRSFRPHLMQGWAPDFISRLTEDALTAELVDEIVPVDGDEALRLARELATAGGHLRRHRRAAPRSRRRSTVARRAPTGHEHRLHAARHRRALPVHAAVRGHRRRHERRGTRDLALDAGLPLRCAPAPPPRAGGGRRARAGRARAAGGAASSTTSSRDEPVVMFALEWCEFCWAVRKLFAQLGIAYRSVDLDSVAYQADDRGGKIRAALARRTGSPTIPQIFVGGEHIGGCTDLFDAWRDGDAAAADEAGIAYDTTSRSTRTRSCRSGCIRARPPEGDRLMTFIATISPGAPDGEGARCTIANKRTGASYRTTHKVFCHRPEVLASWAALLPAIAAPDGPAALRARHLHRRTCAQAAPCARSRTAGCSVNSSRRRTCSRLAGARSHRR